MTRQPKVYDIDLMSGDCNTPWTNQYVKYYSDDTHIYLVCIEEEPEYNFVKINKKEKNKKIIKNWEVTYKSREWEETKEELKKD